MIGGSRGEATKIDVSLGRSRDLRLRRQVLLGELVVSIGADKLPLDVLAGALIEAVENHCSDRTAAWHSRGLSFFQDTGSAVS